MTSERDLVETDRDKWYRAAFFKAGPKIHALQEENNTLRERVAELTAACNALESSAIGPVERFRATGQITLGYKEFCAMAELLPLQGEQQDG